MPQFPQVQNINFEFNQIFPFYFFLQLDHNSIPIELIRTIIMAFWTFICVILFGELGEMITNQFNLYSYELNQCPNWDLFPLEMQRMFAIFLSNAQQLTLIRGYGNELCARATAKEVIPNAKY